MKANRLLIEVETIKYDGTKESFDAIWDWMEDNGGDNLGYIGTETEPGEFKIQSPKGILKASIGDWIIRADDAFYPFSNIKIKEHE